MKPPTQAFLGKEENTEVTICIRILRKINTFKYSRTPLFRSPKGNGKKFEIAGLRNNRGSVKGKGKSKGIRSSLEIAGTSNSPSSK